MKSNRLFHIARCMQFDIIVTKLERILIKRIIKHVKIHDEFVEEICFVIKIKYQVYLVWMMLIRIFDPTKLTLPIDCSSRKVLCRITKLICVFSQRKERKNLESKLSEFWLNLLKEATKNERPKISKKKGTEHFMTIREKFCTNRFFLWITSFCHVFKFIPTFFVV